MSLLGVFAVVFLVASLGACRAQPIPPYKTMEFSQYLDHFNYKDTRRFTQKYLFNDQHGSSNVMLFYTGNEEDIEEFYNNSGFVFELAESFKALVVFAEHRYYGASLPFGEDTFKPENVGYLSVEQALADYAVLIEYLKKEYSLNRVIAVGGSYGGMLTAYIRFKYPNLVDGGLAASAPIFIVANLVDPAAFFAKVTQDFAEVDSSCPDIARRAFSLIYEYAQSGEQGLANLRKEFNVCSLQANQIDHLVGWVKNSFTSLAMMDYPYPTSFLAPLPAFPVREACHLLLQYPNTVTGLAKAAALFYSGSSNDSSCFDIFTQFVSCADPTGCGIGPNSLAWDYQACTEMTLPCITNNVTDMFPPAVYDPSAHCANRWGVAKRGNWTRTQLWGDDIQAASKIIFSNGNLDPWSVGGVLQSSNSKIDLVLIDKAAHHLDLRASNPNDPPSVAAAREKEKDVINSWLD